MLSNYHTKAVLSVIADFFLSIFMGSFGNLCELKISTLRRRYSLSTRSFPANAHFSVRRATWDSQLVRMRQAPCAELPPRCNFCFNAGPPGADRVCAAGEVERGDGVPPVRGAQAGLRRQHRDYAAWPELAVPRLHQAQGQATAQRLRPHGQLVHNTQHQRSVAVRLKAVQGWWRDTGLCTCEGRTSSTAIDEISPQILKAIKHHE